MTIIKQDNDDNDQAEDGSQGDWERYTRLTIIVTIIKHNDDDNDQAEDG